MEQIIEAIRELMKHEEQMSIDGLMDADQHHNTLWCRIIALLD
jgi:hypothetical protein